MSSESSTPVGVLQTTLDLFAVGLELMSQRLRREHPDATEQELEARLVQWLQSRPGAELGDSPGRLIDLDAKSE